MENRTSKLILAEKFLLLALHDEKGTPVIESSHLPLWLNGALLMELAIEGRVTGDKKKMSIADNTPFGDEILDEALQIFAAETKPRPAGMMVQKFNSRIKKLRQRLQDRLVQRGILRLEEGKVLWVFPVNRYPMTDGHIEYEVRNRIRNVVLGGDTPNMETASLIALAWHAKLVNQLFSKEERKMAGPQMKKIAEGYFAAQAVGEVIAGMQAAVIAVIAAAGASSAASS